jgi:ketosteroid isomerase-like protein
MRRWPAASALLTLGLAACVARPEPAGTAPLAADPALEASAARDVAVTFIAAEARGDTSADTLLAPDADFINGGVEVAARPRLAAVIGRGEATVEATRTHVSGPVAWVVAVYGWSGPGAPDPTRARATLILERRAAGWRIRHVHSSAVAPWD